MRPPSTRTANEVPRTPIVAVGVLTFVILMAGRRADEAERALGGVEGDAIAAGIDEAVELDARGRAHLQIGAVVEDEFAAAVGGRRQHLVRMDRVADREAPGAAARITAHILLNLRGAADLRRGEAGGREHAEHDDKCREFGHQRPEPSSIEHARERI